MKELKIKTADGKDFTLAFTRKTVSQMARAGFNIDDTYNKPTIGIPSLFAGAFLRYHRGIKQELVDAIWEELPNKDKLLEVLVQMYQAPIESLLDEPKDDGKNASWEVTE